LNIFYCRITEGKLNSSRKDQNKINSTSTTDTDKHGKLNAKLNSLRKDQNKIIS